MAKKQHEFRCHPMDGGKLRLMVIAEGQAMVRRPGCGAFVISEKDWLALPLWEDGNG